MKYYFALAILAATFFASGASVVLAASTGPGGSVRQNTFFDRMNDLAIGSGYDAETANYSSTLSIALAVERGLKMVFAVLGVIFLSLTVYAGFRWMTAGGNEEQVSEAKALIRNAAIGLAIILLSYAITTFVGSLLGTIGSQ